VSRHVLATRLRRRPLQRVEATAVVFALTLGALTVTQVAVVPAAAAATPTSTGTAGLFVPSQVRALDTRNGTGGYTTNMPAGSWRTVPIDGVGGIPAAGVSSVQVTLTVVAPTATGIANAEASDSTTTPSNAPSALIYNAGVTGTISATTIVAVGADGKIKASTQTSEDLIIDVQGYYTADGGSAAPGGYVPIIPKRVVDTRSGLGSTMGPVAANSTSTYQIAGGTSGVPIGASAVFALLTPVSTSATGSYFTSYPTGGTVPNTSINYPGNIATVIGGAVDLSDAGRLNVKFAGGGINFLVDVLGYYTATPGVSGAYTPAATRVYDSRVSPNVAVPANTTVSIPVAGIKGVPLAGSGISAIGMNVQVAKGSNTSGFLRVWAGDQAEPTPTAVNYPANASTRTDFLVVAPGTDGSVKLHNIGANSINVILDVSGWYSNVGTAVAASQTRTQKFITLQAATAGGGPWATYQYRKGITGFFSSVPTADVTVPGTATHPASWPVGHNTAGNFDPYTWDLATTVGGGDQLIQVQACYGTSSTDSNPVCSMPTNVQLASHAFGDSYDTQQIGPGDLATLTGDYEINATDVNQSSYLGALTAGRSFATLAPAPERTTAAGVFGPGWTSNFAGPATGNASASVQDNGTQGYLNFNTPNGGVDLYQATTPTGTYPTSFVPVGDAATNGENVTKTAANTIVMTDRDGTITTWIKNSTGVWAVSDVAQLGSASSTTYTTDSSGRPTRILGAVPAGINCVNPDTTRGCRSLTFDYVTVAGAAKSRLAGINLVAFDPVAAAMSSTAVAAYSYNASGQLTQEWDPRIVPNLKTAYTYDSNGRLATMTPPGLATWTLSYDGSGRLSTTSRPDPSGLTATSTVIYGVPFSGIGAPVDVGAATSATWGQTGDPAATSTAVFGPNHVPAGTTAATVTTADWPYAEIHYLDVSGRNSNTASYGAGSWQTDATVHDTNGNTVWQLSPGNRAQSLLPTTDTSPTASAASTTAARAALLATTTVYDTLQPAKVTDSFGPLHPITLADHTVVEAHTHTATVYDEGAPADGTTYLLPTTKTQSGQTLDGVDHDTVTTHLGYAAIISGDPTGWSLRQATSSTVQMRSTPSASDLTAITRYNATGQIIETRLPAGSGGGDARSTVTAYYAATGNGQCVSQDQAGLICTTAPAAQPTTGNPLPVTTTTYNAYGEPLTATAVAGTTSKVVSTAYDSAGRTTGSSVIVTPTAAGETALPPITNSYSSLTGLPTGSTAGSQNLSTVYDNLGQAATYTDATGNVSTTGHDTSGRITSISDGKGTTTYTFDSSSEHRGLPTTEDAGAGAAPSTFSATYNPDGQLDSQTYPTGMQAFRRYNNQGAATYLNYVKGNKAWMTFAATRDAMGRIATHNSGSSAQHYSYDADGRLISVEDTVATSQSTANCTTRTYTFDKNSNRLSLATYADGGGAAAGNCSTAATPTTVTSTFDEADRLTNTGYVYDTFGRTVIVPAADANGTASKAAFTGNLTVGYYANDMLASQSQSTATRTFTLDPQQNRTQAMSDGTNTTTNHYSNDQDSPSWTLTAPTSVPAQTAANTTWSRNIIGLDGNLVGFQTSSGTVTLQIQNLHGDIVATVDDDPAATTQTNATESTEYGTPRNAAAAPDIYSWLGAQQRSADSLGGLILMGVRLYNLTTGRFLTVDPVVGGGANRYAYPTDPINMADTSGAWWSWLTAAARAVTNVYNWAKGELTVIMGSHAFRIFSGYAALATCSSAVVSWISSHRFPVSGTLGCAGALFYFVVFK